MATAEPTVRVAVTVTFLRMDRPPSDPIPPLPEGVHIIRVANPDVQMYRRLYADVGGAYLWWLRRAMTDEQLNAILQDPRISIYVLNLNNETAGFFELDANFWPYVNLNYFGLLPAYIGKGLGYPFLRRAVAEVWAQSVRGMIVNTCTADHPRALQTYLRAGFRQVRQVREVWDIPTRLNLAIPDSLRV